MTEPALDQRTNVPLIGGTRTERLDCSRPNLSQVERRSAFRRMLDGLGLRSHPERQQARHPERIGLK